MTSLREGPMGKLIPRREDSTPAPAPESTDDAAKEPRKSVIAS